jgi:pyruvate formate lyase activating enzyme
MRVTRRDLLRLGLGCALGGGALTGVARYAASGRAAPAWQPRPQAEASPGWTRRARYYRKLANQRVRCQLCPRECEVGPAERGFCGVRENRGGEYYTLVYGRAASLNIDPVEKKPFFHVLPASMVFSFATAGCNLSCKNCQNWDLSQSRPEQIPAVDLPPRQLVEQAHTQGCSLVAGTYSEPTVFAEYLLDVAREGNTRGLRTTMVSSGYLAKQPLLDLTHELAAIKIDLKSMREGFYRSTCAGTLQPVLATIELVRKQRVWLEIVYLVIPTLNDSDREIEDLARWVKGHVGADVPLHFSRFYPQYRLKNLPPTPYDTMTRCYDTARAEGLHYVYVGNVPGHPGESTYCPKCKRVLIRRRGFTVTDMVISHGQCPSCHHTIPGIWS